MEVFFVVEECTGPLSVDRVGWSETKEEDTLIFPINVYNSLTTQLLASIDTCTCNYLFKT